MIFPATNIPKTERRNHHDVVEFFVELIKAETHAAACSARRSIGQLLRRDRVVKPIWQQLAEIGESAPAGAWDGVPRDLSTRGER